MDELGLIRQLETLLGHPLEEISEDRFKRHAQAKSALDGANRIARDAYSLAQDGTVSGLCLQPVTSHILLDFPFHGFRQLKYLYLKRVNVSSFDFIAELEGLTTIDLSANRISDGSFLQHLTGLTTLDLSANRISDGTGVSNG